MLTVFQRNQTFGWTVMGGVTKTQLQTRGRALHPRLQGCKGSQEASRIKYGLTIISQQIMERNEMGKVPEENVM